MQGNAEDVGEDGMYELFNGGLVKVGTRVVDSVGYQYTCEALHSTQEIPVCINATMQIVNKLMSIQEQVVSLV